MMTAETTAKVSELSAPQAQAEDRLVSCPSGAGLRQSDGSPMPLTRVSPSLPKNGGTWAMCQQAHPIGSWYPQAYHTCLFCPPELRQQPGMWHLDHESGKLQPPGMTAPQSSRKRGFPLCSLLARVKRFCSGISPPTPRIVLHEEQKEEEDEAGVEKPQLEKSAKELEVQLMEARTNEAGALAKLIQMRQKVMELETLNHACTTQLDQRDFELKRVREDMENLAKAKEELAEKFRSEKLEFILKESQLQAECMKERLKNSEGMQNLQKLQDKITLLELKKADNWSLFRHRTSSDSSSDSDVSCSNEDRFVAVEDMDVLIDSLAVAFSALSISVRREANNVSQRPGFNAGLDSDADTDLDEPLQQAPPSPLPAPVVAVPVQAPVLLLGPPPAAPLPPVQVVHPVPSRSPSPPAVLLSPSPQPRVWTLTPAWLGRAGLLRLRQDDLSAVPRRLLYGIRNGMPAQETAIHLEVLLICIDEALLTYKLILDDVLTLNRWTPFIGRALDSSLKNSSDDLARLERLLPKIMRMLEKLH